MIIKIRTDAPRDKLFSVRVFRFRCNIRPEGRCVWVAWLQSGCWDHSRLSTCRPGSSLVHCAQVAGRLYRGRRRAAPYGGRNEFRMPGSSPVSGLPRFGRTSWVHSTKVSISTAHLRTFCKRPGISARRSRTWVHFLSTHVMDLVLLPAISPAKPRISPILPPTSIKAETEAWFSISPSRAWTRVPSP